MEVSWKVELIVKIYNYLYLVVSMTPNKETISKASIEYDSDHAWISEWLVTHYL